MTGSFTGELWQSVTGVCEAILKHPFLAGLADGSLPYDAEERARLHRNFRTTSRCEWMFWDMGYRTAGRPIAV